MKFLSLSILLCLAACGPAMAEPAPPAVHPEAPVAKASVPTSIPMTPEQAKEIYAALQGAVQDRCGTQLSALKALETAAQTAIAPKAP